MVLLFLHLYMELSLIGSGKLGRQLHRVFAQDSSIKFIQWMNRSAALSGSIPIDLKVFFFHVISQFGANSVRAIFRGRPP